MHTPLRLVSIRNGHLFARHGSRRKCQNQGIKEARRCTTYANLSEKLRYGAHGEHAFRAYYLFLFDAEVCATAPWHDGANLTKDSEAAGSIFIIDEISNHQVGQSEPSRL
ncbi:hypothetical protein CEXT_583231 [Caerostris extrusa]|uniref:Uncharacterized protein n=1 Tax=Caerostris extrusa TaxID=172846 RepID=A0AAV4R1J9_CAEEX|nr:hypothetical protein CEXT_583231 [Caerostris extrusa]